MQRVQHAALSHRACDPLPRPAHSLPRGRKSPSSDPAEAFRQQAATKQLRGDGVLLLKRVTLPAHRRSDPLLRRAARRACGRWHSASRTFAARAASLGVSLGIRLELLDGRGGGGRPILLEQRGARGAPIKEVCANTAPRACAPLLHARRPGAAALTRSAPGLCAPLRLGGGRALRLSQLKPGSPASPHAKRSGYAAATARSLASRCPPGAQESASHKGLRCPEQHQGRRRTHAAHAAVRHHAREPAVVRDVWLHL